MPHVSEAVAAFHDRHDLLLVAAFAAGDLTGTERDQAVALTTSCSECAALRDDLVSIARATATLPPPIPSAGRDFRLTPAQAASLGRTGWRRLLPAGFSAGTARGLGVALATFGLAGLLLGNVSLNFGLGSGASATAAPAAAGPAENSTSGGSSDALAAQPAPAASSVFAAASAAAASAGAAVPAPSAAASAGFPVFATAAPSAGGLDQGGAVAGGSGGRSGGPVTAAASAGGSVAPVPVSTANDLAESSAPSGGSFPLVPISVAALIVGVVLIVVSLRSRRATL